MSKQITTTLLQRQKLAFKSRIGIKITFIKKVIEGILMGFSYTQGFYGLPYRFFAFPCVLIISQFMFAKPINVSQGIYF